MFENVTVVGAGMIRSGSACGLQHRTNAKRKGKGGGMYPGVTGKRFGFA